MGGGSWTTDSYRSYASTTGYQTKGISEVFTSSRLPPQFDPKLITVRESVDSEDNPNSTPIILALDVT